MTRSNYRISAILLLICFVLILFSAVYWHKNSKELTYIEVSNIKEQYTVGLEGSYMGPEGWEVQGVGSNSGDFEEGINSAIGSSTSDEKYGHGMSVQILIERVSEQDNISQYAQVRKMTIVGGKKVYIDRYPYFLSRKYAIENKMELIEIAWEENNIENFYFLARCDGDYDYRDILEEACFEMVKTWKVVE